VSIKLDRQQKEHKSRWLCCLGCSAARCVQSSDCGFGGSQRQCVPAGPVSTNNWSTKQLICG